MALSIPISDTVLPLAHDRERDAELAARVRAGDSVAFESLFRVYYRPLAEFALGYVVSNDDANDVVAAVFAKLWERRASWAPASVSRYLYGAVRNLALTRVRDVRRTAQHDLSLAREAHAERTDVSHSDAEQRMEAVERSVVLKRLVEHLTVSQRLVLMLRWQHELSFAEIADALGTTEAAAKMQLSRALRALRAVLPDYIL